MKKKKVGGGGHCCCDSCCCCSHSHHCHLSPTLVPVHPSHLPLFTPLPPPACVCHSSMSLPLLVPVPPHSFMIAYTCSPTHLCLAFICTHLAFCAHLDHCLHSWLVPACMYMSPLVCPCLFVCSSICAAPCHSRLVLAHMYVSLLICMFVHLCWPPLPAYPHVLVPSCPYSPALICVCIKYIISTYIINILTFIS